MIYAKKQLPKYCHHKPSGRAYVRLGTKMFYLGKYGSEVSRREYDRIISEFIANGRRPFQHQDEILIESLIVQYLDHVTRELKIGESRKRHIVQTVMVFNELYGKQPVAAFGTASLKTLRKQWIAKGLGRATINGYVGIRHNHREISG